MIYESHQSLFMKDSEKIVHFNFVQGMRFLR